MHDVIILHYTVINCYVLFNSAPKILERECLRNFCLEIILNLEGVRHAPACMTCVENCHDAVRNCICVVVFLILIKKKLCATSKDEC